MRLTAASPILSIDRVATQLRLRLTLPRIAATLAVDQILLPNPSPGPLSHGACAVVRARLGLAVATSGRRRRFWVAPVLGAFEINQDWLERDPLA